MSENKSEGGLGGDENEVDAGGTHVKTTVDKSNISAMAQGPHAHASSISNYYGLGSAEVRRIVDEQIESVVREKKLAGIAGGVEGPESTSTTNKLSDANQVEPVVYEPRTGSTQASGIRAQWHVLLGSIAFAGVAIATVYVLSSKVYEAGGQLWSATSHRPIANAVVLLIGPKCEGGRTTTDVDGKFTIACKIGPYDQFSHRVNIRLPGRSEYCPEPVALLSKPMTSYIEIDDDTCKASVSPALPTLPEAPLSPQSAPAAPSTPTAPGREFWSTRQFVEVTSVERPEDTKKLYNVAAEARSFHGSIEIWFARTSNDMEWKRRHFLADKVSADLLRRGVTSNVSEVPSDSEDFEGVRLVLAPGS